MQLVRRILVVLSFSAGALAQTTFSCPANQYVSSQLINTGQACSALPPASLLNVETAGAGGVTVNTFVSKDTSAPTRFITAPSGSCGSGVALATVASGSTFTLSGYEGTVQVTADSGGITAGHLIVGSTVTPGRAMDAGTSTSLSVSELKTVCGTALNSVASGGLVTMNPRSRGSFGHLIDNINGTLLSGLATGLVKNTTGTGAATIAVSGTDYQAPITLTTTGSSGAATLSAGTLNIPQYAGGSTTFQQNGTGLASSTTVNFVNGTGNGGIVFTNPSVGNVNANLSLPIAGAGAGFTTGPASGVTSGDVACFTGTAGQLADCFFSKNNVVQKNIATTFTATQTFAGVVAGGTTFTIASGCGTAASLTGGAQAGSFAAGQTACAPVVTTGVTAPHGFSCWANDLTTPADTIHQIATTATTFTLSGTVVSGDVVNFGCLAY